MKYQIFGVTDAVWKCLIGYIYCVTPCFGDCRNPFGKCLILFLFSPGEACATCQERVFSIFIYRFSLCESVTVGFLPTGFAAFHLQIDGTVSCIVVHNHLILLSIPLPGGIDISSGVFEHRDDIRQNERLREQVLGSAEQTWTLPSPFAFIVLVIFAMALPQRDVPVLQSFGYFVRAGGVYHPRCSFIFCV